MARGGYRENSGRKTSWASGCGFDDTKTIRVPKTLVDQLTEIAHKLDSGETIGLDTESFDALLEENSQAKEEIHRLQHELDKCCQELREKKKYSRQLGLNLTIDPVDNILQELTDQALDHLKLGQQAIGYKVAKKACKKFAELLKEDFEIVSKS